jgi:hypothetical protein
MIVYDSLMLNHYHYRKTHYDWGIDWGNTCFLLGSLSKSKMMVKDMISWSFTSHDWRINILYPRCIYNSIFIYIHLFIRLLFICLGYLFIRTKNIGCATIYLLVIWWFALGNGLSSSMIAHSKLLDHQMLNGKCTTKWDKTLIKRYMNQWNWLVVSNDSVISDLFRWYLGWWSPMTFICFRVVETTSQVRIREEWSIRSTARVPNSLATQSLN